MSWFKSLAAAFIEWYENRPPPYTLVALFFALYPFFVVWFGDVSEWGSDPDVAASALSSFAGAGVCASLVLAVMDGRWGR